MDSNKKNTLAESIVSILIDAISASDIVPEHVKKEISAMDIAKEASNQIVQFIGQFIMTDSSKENADIITKFSEYTTEYLEKIKNLMEENTNVSE